jgi:hypothetical protein
VVFLYAADGGCKILGLEVVNERLSLTGREIAQAARATTGSFASVLAHAAGVNCLISVIFAEGMALAREPES